MEKTGDEPSDKPALRKTLFARRKAAHLGDRAEAVARANRRLLDSGLLDGAGIVAGYRPIRTEIDPTPAMAALAGRGVRLCVPVIPGAGMALVFRLWAPGAPMETGAFGAEIPSDPTEAVPDALIVPLVGFDAAGWRLGYGGGFYDRTLEALRALRPTRAVGVAYAAQEVDTVPREPTDQPLDAIVTEDRLILP